MKRTRELIFREHPPWEQRSNISNCQFFDGEDSEFYHRQKSDSQKQKQWLEQQSKENRLRAELKLMEDKLLGQQVLHLNRQRGILQDHVQAQKKALVQAQNQKNLELIAEKQQQQWVKKQEKRQEELDELAIDKLRGTKKN